MTTELNINNKLWTVHRCQQAALAVCIVANVPSIIWGKPGVGKTQTIRAIADAYDMHLVISILSASDMTDLQGYPVLEDGVSKLAPRKWVQDVINASEGVNEKDPLNAKKRHSIVFWDEISTAPPSTQAPALTIILDKLAGDTQMPMTTRMIGAANPPDIAANGWDLSAPMANRFTHLDWDVDIDTAVRGFQMGWETPPVPMLPTFKKKSADGSITELTDEEVIERHAKNARLLVGSFLRKKPTAISHDFSTWGMNSGTFKASQNAFPSLRAWDSVARLYAVCKIATYDGEPVNPEVARMLIAGTVGEQLANEFLAYTSSLELVDPVQILRDPNAAEVPEALDKLSAVLASLRNTCMSQRSKSVYPRLWDSWGFYLMKVVDSGSADLAFTHVQEWWNNRPNNHAPQAGVVEKMQSFVDRFNGG